MKIYVNGKEKEVNQNSTIQDVINDFNAKSPMLVVERNLKIVPKDEYEFCQLREEDNIEIVGFFGGG